MPNVDNPFVNGVLIALSISRWGNRKKISLSELTDDIEVDEKWVAGVKRLINPEAFALINTISSRAIQRVRTLSLYFPMRGIWFVPKKLISRLDAELKQDKEEFISAVDELEEHWQNSKEEAKEAWGEKYNEFEYPRHIKDKFEFNWRFFFMDIPNKNLGLLSPEQYQEEVDKMKKTVVEARNLAVQAIREEFKKILIDAIAKLKGEKGERLHKSVIEKFKTFFDLFQDKNVFKDNEMAEIVDMAKDLLEGVDIKDVRKDEEFKADLAKELVEVKKELDKAMVRKAARKIVMFRIKGV